MMTYSIKSVLITAVVSTGALFFMGPLYAIVVAAIISLGIVVGGTMGMGVPGIDIPPQALEWIRLTLLGVIGVALAGIVATRLDGTAFVFVLLGVIVAAGITLYKWDPVATAANE